MLGGRPRRRMPTAAPLTGHDLCDRCAARACVRMVRGARDLLFCNHHYRWHAGALRAAGWLVGDDTRTA
jgi:hypothetical protein